MGRYILRARRPIAIETTEVILTPKTGEHFEFLPGQYAELILPDPKYTDDYGNRRELSIASTPNESELRFAWRNSQSAWKRSLAELELGAEIEVNGPYGLMTLPTDPNLKIALIGGGIGVTPFRSIVLGTKHQERPLHLLFANRDEASAPYLEELRSQQSNNFQLLEHFGLLTADVVAKLIAESQADLYFIAGPLGFTNLAQETLTEAGVPRLNILVEQFTGYE